MLTIMIIIVIIIINNIYTSVYQKYAWRHHNYIYILSWYQSVTDPSGSDQEVNGSHYWTGRVTDAEDGPTHLCKPPIAREVGLKPLKIAELNLINWTKEFGMFGSFEIWTIWSPNKVQRKIFALPASNLCFAASISATCRGGIHSFQKLENVKNLMAPDTSCSFQKPTQTI